MSGGFDPFGWAGDVFKSAINLVSGAVKTIGKVATNILHNPLPVIETVALTAALGPGGLAVASTESGAYALASAATSALNGGNVEQIALSAASAWAGGQVGQQVGTAVESGTMPFSQQTFQLSAQNAGLTPSQLQAIVTGSSGAAAAAALSGKSLDQILVAGATGATASIVNQQLIDRGFDPSKLDTKLINNSVTSAVNAIMNGRSVTNAIGGAVASTTLSAVVRDASTAVKNAYNAYQNSSGELNNLSNEYNGKLKTTNDYFNNVLNPMQVTAKQQYDDAVSAQNAYNTSYSQYQSLVDKYNNAKDWYDNYDAKLAAQGYKMFYDEFSSGYYKAVQAMSYDDYGNATPAVYYDENTGQVMPYMVPDWAHPYNGPTQDSYVTVANDAAKAVDALVPTIQAQADTLNSKISTYQTTADRVLASQETYKGYTGQLDTLGKRINDLSSTVQRDGDALTSSINNLNTATSEAANQVAHSAATEATANVLNTAAQDLGYADYAQQKLASDNGFTSSTAYHDATAAGFTDARTYNTATAAGFTDATSYKDATDNGFSNAASYNFAKKAGFDNAYEYNIGMSNARDAALAYGNIAVTNAVAAGNSDVISALINNDFAGAKTAAMTFGGSFNDAFSQARQAGLKEFYWNGLGYNTDVKVEGTPTSTEIDPRDRDALRNAPHRIQGDVGASTGTSGLVNAADAALSAVSGTANAQVAVAPPPITGAAVGSSAAAAGATTPGSTATNTGDLTSVTTPTGGVTTTPTTQANTTEQTLNTGALNTLGGTISSTSTLDQIIKANQTAWDNAQESGDQNLMMAVLDNNPAVIAALSANDITGAQRALSGGLASTAATTVPTSTTRPTVIPTVIVIPTPTPTVTTLPTTVTTPTATTVPTTLVTPTVTTLPTTLVTTVPTTMPTTVVVPTVTTTATTLPTATTATVQPTTTVEPTTITVEPTVTVSVTPTTTTKPTVIGGSSIPLLASGLTMAGAAAAQKYFDPKLDFTAHMTKGSPINLVGVPTYATAPTTAAPAPSTQQQVADMLATDIGSGVLAYADGGPVQHFEDGGAPVSLDPRMQKGRKGYLTPFLGALNQPQIGMPTFKAYSEGGEVIDHTPQFYSEGGLGTLQNKYVKGPGDGTSDSVPAMLANGEFVIPADVVSKLGNGSNDAGAGVLDQFLVAIRQHAQDHKPSKLPPKSKGPLAYLLEAQRKVKRT